MSGRSSSALVALSIAMLVSPACASQPPATAARHVAPVRDGELLAPERLAALPEPERAAWQRYIERSRRLHDADTASMNAELRAAGQTRMVKATYAAAMFDLADDK